MDDDLKALARDWQAWDGGAQGWLHKALVAHRREAALQASYWAALLIGALAMAVQGYLHGVVSWPRVLFGAGALLFGAGVMLYAGAQVKRSRRALTVTPEGVIADLRQILLRELDGWTARWVKISLAVLVSVSAALALEHLAEAVRGQQSLVEPAAVLVALVAALAVIARVGVVRVRTLRRELAELERAQQELVQ